MMGEVGGDRPIIFLDVDGVLVIRTEVRRPRPMGIRANGMAYRRPPAHVGYVSSFNRACVDQLNKLAANTDALLVMSSSWRLRLDARDQLAAAGVADRWHHHWRTDNDDGGRGAEITRWISANKPSRYIVLDDWPHELAAHRDHLLKCDFKRGFMEADRMVAETVLASQPSGPASSPLGG